MSFLKKIFNWKVFFFCYLAFWFILFVAAPVDEFYLPFEYFISIIGTITFIFGLSLCYSVAWKKRLYNMPMFVILSILSVISCALSLFVALMHYNGEINSYVIYSTLISLIVNTFPMVVAFFIYIKNQKSYETINKPVLKFMLSFIILNNIVGMVRLVYFHTNSMYYNVFDYISIFANIIICIFCGAIILDKKINIKAIKPIAIYCIGASLIPFTLVSREFLMDTNTEVVLYNMPILIFAELVNIFIAFVIYRYVFVENK